MYAHQIFLNANVITMNPRQPAAKAFATVGDRFLAVGGRSDMEAIRGPQTRTVDLQFRTVLPGFIESHSHISAYAMNMMRVDCSSPDNSSIEDIKDRIRSKALETHPGEWIQGFGYNDTLIGEKRHLTREDLDAAAPDHPVQIMHISMHFSYVNSQAMKIARIGANTEQSEGGEIEKRPDGQPTGLMIEAGAMDLVRCHIPPYTVDQLKAALIKAFADFHRAGITSTQDGGIGYFQHGPQVIKAYQELLREGNLSLRITMTIVEEIFRDLFAAGLRSGFGNEFLKLGAVKTWQDGSIQGFTGALIKPYYSRPEYRGDLLIDQAKLEKMVADYHAGGQQIAIHANGDRAIESVLLAFEKAHVTGQQTDRRHMIIHCQMANNDHIRRMKRLGIIPNYFINHVYYWGDLHRDIFLGSQRAAHMNPLQSSLRSGLAFCLHSDLPVTPVDPLAAIHTAVNRLTSSGQLLGPEERIAVESALRAYTTTAAFAEFEEIRKGAIQPGLLADFVVLSEDPQSVPTDTIKAIEPLETFLGGERV